jgi:glycosyltransferase involved in cell wall biosynthesis
MTPSIPEPVPVMFLTDLLTMGGAETQLVELTRALDPQRVRAEVAVLRPGGELAGSVRVPLHRLGFEGRAVWKLLRPLRRLLEEREVRALYTTHVWSALLAAALCRRIRPPQPQMRLAWIDSEHSFRMAPASPLLERVRRRALERADRIVAVSQVQAAWLRDYLGCRPARLEIVPNGIAKESFDLPVDDGSVRREFGIPPHAPIVASLARLSPEKRLIDLVEAMEQVEAHLLLVGDGPERGALESRARAPELAGRIHFAGTRLDPRPCLAAATLFCLPSQVESQPLAVCEAMAAGLPVIATRVGGLPEVVEDGVTGLLVPPRDPVRLASTLRWALQDEAWRERAGEAGRQRARRFYTIEARARRLESLFIEAVRETALAPGQEPAHV